MNSCCNYLEPDFEQMPAESIVYTVDWPNRGLPIGAVIISQEYLPSGPTDYTISNTSIVDDGLQTQFQITGGIAGTTYAITNKISISDSQIFETTLIFNCVAQNVRQRDTCL